MINLSKLIVVTTANYCIRKSIKQIDYFVSQPSANADTLTMTCCHCQMATYVMSCVVTDIFRCPFCFKELNNTLFIDIKNNVTVTQNKILPEKDFNLNDS